MENLNMTFSEFAEHIMYHIESNPALRDLPIYLSKDGEGNNFRPFSGDFEIENRIDIDDTVEDRDDEEYERCIVFYPNW